MGFRLAFIHIEYFVYGLYLQSFRCTHICIYVYLNVFSPSLGMKHCTWALETVYGTCGFGRYIGKHGLGV